MALFRKQMVGNDTKVRILYLPPKTEYSKMGNVWYLWFNGYMVPECETIELKEAKEILGESYEKVIVTEYDGTGMPNKWVSYE